MSRKSIIELTELNRVMQNSHKQLINWANVDVAEEIQILHRLSQWPSQLGGKYVTCMDAFVGKNSVSKVNIQIVFVALFFGWP